MLLQWQLEPKIVKAVKMIAPLLIFYPEWVMVNSISGNIFLPNH